MATFSIEIPDDLAVRIVDAFMVEYGYTGAIEDGPAFVQSKVMEWLVDITRSYEIRMASQEAAQAAHDVATEDFQVLLNTSVNTTPIPIGPGGIEE